MGRENKAKPLSFSTTLRNPERIADFIKCIIPFEGMNLTSDVINAVVRSVIRNKIYYTMYEMRNANYKRIYGDDSLIFTEGELDDIINNSPQKHKEAGFDYGWDSRFDTWYKMIKEFGFIYYNMDEPIVITTTGHMLVDAFMETPCNGLKIQKIFLNAMAKYQTNNPLRRNVSKNAPLPFLLNVIKYFHDDPDENDAGLARHELPILICWQENDPFEAYKFIKEIRNDYGFRCSDEYIYDKCLYLLGSENRKLYKMSKICKEAVDEYIRKMRMTGVVSLRGNGRFLDINTFENDIVDYIISNYSTFDCYTDEKLYVEYMSDMDSKILQTNEKIKLENIQDIKKKTLYKYAEEMDKETVFKELKNVCKGNESKHESIRYLDGPVRLEFLTSIALVQNFKGLDVNPNYSVDDEGLPTFTASGGMSDIEAYDVDYDSYYEVTLMKGRANQVNNEIIPIGRHLREIKETRRENSFSVFVAPIIHEDTREAADWQKVKYNIDILTYDIDEFIHNITKSKKASDLLLM